MLVHNVEQNSEEWLILRAGKPTASEFSRLITSTGSASKSLSGYAMQLAGELYAGKPLDTWMGNAYTERGHEIEEEARLAYEMRADVAVERVGFITDDAQNYGCSPDGLVDSDGLVEFKCLPKKHIEALLYYKKNGAIPPDYVQQVQGQIFVTGREWADLVFYQPDLPMLIVREYRDSRIISALETQLFECLRERDRVLEILHAMEDAA